MTFNHQVERPSSADSGPRISASAAIGTITSAERPTSGPKKPCLATPTMVKGTRSIDQRLALTGTAETLLAALPGRLMLKPGRQSGETAGHRWRVDVYPLKMAAESDAPQTGRFVPLAVSMQVQAPGGPLMQITTVRLVPRGAE